MSAPGTVHAALLALLAQGLSRLEAQMLVLHICGISPQDRAWLLTHETQALEAGQQAQMNQLAQRRLAGEPMAYLLGIKNFHALTLKIDARVLDPRDDTESLVEWALRVAPDTAPLKVLDLGTGSGAIALALAYSRPHWQVFASDLSADALNLARDNAQQLGLRVHWAQGDWWAPWGGQRFDLLVSNPPYIAANDPHLSALRHEPELALVSGAEGLDAIRQIIHRAGEHLSEGAWLLLEHGHDQAAAVRTLLSQAGFAGVTSERDLAGIERCSGGFWPCAKNVTA